MMQIFRSTLTGAASISYSNHVFRSTQQILEMNLRELKDSESLSAGFAPGVLTGPCYCPPTLPARAFPKH